MQGHVQAWVHVLLHSGGCSFLSERCLSLLFFSAGSVRHTETGFPCLRFVQARPSPATANAEGAVAMPALPMEEHGQLLNKCRRRVCNSGGLPIVDVTPAWGGQQQRSTSPDHSPLAWLGKAIVKLDLGCLKILGCWCCVQSWLHCIHVCTHIHTAIPTQAFG